MYTGDTTIGLKGRIVFEAPGLTALLAAHRALEEAVLTKQQNRFKPESRASGWSWCTKASTTTR
jgi:argininosuccinate synthase